ncbi:glycosyl hydrolase 2 galactose-binding domain-containing protein [Sphingomonas morindae]|uniref:Beta galactosidase jelly roll domain-containing protein n=1 Tax=Sphingomonas morindae TaxID=1541170 RepID=A0ABY4X6A7_9SPHN|nr:LamG-like jellyroll fold domain-containing protein [Sphingomonas morindae]USI72430.1 beta galactosidase jelly roll domain-containing protein [Sphingomonas morindae]
MSVKLTAAIALAALAAAQAYAQPAQTGPYDVALIAGGDAAAQPIAPALRAAPWTLHFWIAADRAAPRAAPLVALGGDQALVLRNGAPGLMTDGHFLRAGVTLAPGAWHHIALVAEPAALTLFVDGRRAGRVAAAPAPLPEQLRIGGGSPDAPGFSGRIAALALVPGARDAAALRAAAATPPSADLIQFATNSPHWPVQVRQMMGQTSPQPPATRPTSRTPADAPQAKPVPTGPALAETAPGRWLVHGWRLAAAPDVTADGPRLSRAGFDAQGWLVATMPGTVLTTLIDRGVYPDPAHGLNNLAIPEKLAHQDYWYRTEFDLPAGAAGRHLELVVGGANYQAELWVNGQRLGDMKGAFIRGRFDLTAALRPGRNAIAVKVSPPPHVGLAHEESLTAGVGENGGVMMLDGPTFGATEGWDWIPTVRDRNTGLWQDVELRATGEVTLGDAQVVTALPDGDTKLAEIEIDVPVHNQGTQPATTEVEARFDDVRVSRSVTLAPGATQTVRFLPADFAQLRVRNPRLWWPNGYGEPALHMLHLSATSGGQPSDAKDVRFGMREVRYELSLVDPQGDLDRVAINLTKARETGTPLVDVRHQAIRQVPGGWAYALTPEALHSPAVTPIKGDAGLSPFLVLRVNGVRIAARGGNIGMDDFLKRTERGRLEPFMRLQRDAHLNVVRNWIGQNTEETFFDLADEYGLMVLNDFWESTQDYNIEAQDVPLFLKNAEDVVRRYRNHPSIVLWFGRNEGVPQPILNEGLDALIRREDGTRLYMGSSNRINLHDSGPYNWRPEDKYFTEYSNGFAVEVGTPSFPTLESWKRTIPASELWPISDSWAYHDWHQTGNGAVASFTDAMARRFGPATSLEDFERKAQMLEYDSYRAIFEGMNAGLWTRNSGRMLWMTQPAWPSSAWQIFSSDYDTHGAFYGVQKGSEPLHVQMNLPDHAVVLVNSRPDAAGTATVRARVETLDGRVVLTREAKVATRPGVNPAFTLDLAPALAAGPVLVRLEAKDGGGTRLSDNFYWQAASDEGYRALAALPPVTLQSSATGHDEGSERVIAVTLSNPGKTAAIETKLALVDAAGKQVLPAYFSDNYVSLLPGESRMVTVRAPALLAGAAPKVTLRGFNIAPAAIAVGQ